MNPALRNESGSTALAYAARQGHENVVKLFLTGEHHELFKEGIENEDEDRECALACCSAGARGRWALASRSRRGCRVLCASPPSPL